LIETVVLTSMSLGKTKILDPFLKVWFIGIWFLCYQLRIIPVEVGPHT